MLAKNSKRWVTTVYKDDGAVIKLSAPQTNGVYQGGAFAKQQFIEAKIARSPNALYWLDRLFVLNGTDYLSEE